MLDTPETIGGGCHCGRVRLDIAQRLRPPINCHCRLCRHLSGAAFTTWLSVKREALTVEGREFLSSYRPTENLERLFCAHCGGHVLTYDGRMETIAGIPAGLLDDQVVEPPAGDYFVGHKALWHRIAPGQSCFGGDSGMQPLADYHLTKA